MLVCTSRAGQAGGGSFKRENYRPNPEFAYRMCAGRSTSAMPKPRCLCAVAFGRSVWGLAFWWWLVVFLWCVGVGDVMC